jgi:transposase
VRKVYNLALAARTEAWTRQERVNCNQTSAMLTVWKKTEELAYLNEVSSVPLQQALRHLQTAFTNFFGKRAKYPRFKSRKKYKAQWYGRDVIAIGRWFPSSRLCSVCGTLQGKMPLNVREWMCGCGTTHDRDVNAAKNILAVGLTASVCGAGARPQRSTPGGQSAMKQKPLRREP